MCLFCVRVNKICLFFLLQYKPSRGEGGFTAYENKQFYMEDGTLPGLCFLEEDVMRSVTFFSATDD
jgi:hypothetical protein